jgi:hypothetical protein
MSELFDLRILYYFSCDEVDVLEVKINGLEVGTPMDRLYHWLCYDRMAKHIQKLQFKSMGKDGERNLRVFEQGHLWFEDTQAGLMLQTGSVLQNFQLGVQAVDAVSKAQYSLIQDFLQKELGK